MYKIWHRKDVKEKLGTKSLVNIYKIVGIALLLSIIFVFLLNFFFLYLPTVLTNSNEYLAQWAGFIFLILCAIWIACFASKKGLKSNTADWIFVRDENGFIWLVNYNSPPFQNIYNNLPADKKEHIGSVNELILYALSFVSNPSIKSSKIEAERIDYFVRSNFIEKIMETCPENLYHIGQRIEKVFWLKERNHSFRIKVQTNKIKINQDFPKLYDDNDVLIEELKQYMEQEF